MSEEWCDVKGFEGLYQVSNLGRVHSIPRKVLTSTGYRSYAGKDRKLQVKTSDGEVIVYLKDVAYGVHRLVATAFIPNPKGLSTVRHKDGNKLNICADNLEWSKGGRKPSHNIALSIDTLTIPAGA